MWTKTINNDNIIYSFREAFVHKLCNQFSGLPKTFCVCLNDLNLTVQMEHLSDVGVGNPVDHFIQILKSVAVLHYFSIAHRDIKSDNIMYRNNKAVLIDFGLAKILEKDGDNTPEVVSIFYRSPELPTEKYGFEIDSWALGVWGLELFNQEFDPDFDDMDLALQNVPIEIRSIIKSFLKVDPKKRSVPLDWIDILHNKKFKGKKYKTPRVVRSFPDTYYYLRNLIETFQYSKLEKKCVAIWLTFCLCSDAIDYKIIEERYKINNLLDICLEIFYLIKF